MKRQITHKNKWPKKKYQLDFLTIVLLTYNRKEYAQKALEAILNQSHPQFKILIIDNHSTDGTVESITSQIKDDERATYVRLNKKSNAGNSFHEGVMLSRSEFVLVTHDDDILELDYVENLIKILSIDPDIGLIASNTKLIDQSGNITNEKLYPLKNDIIINKGKYLDLYLNRKIWLPTPSLCFRKIHYLNYVGHDVYPMYTKRNSTSIKSKLIEYTPSKDILFNLYINEFQKIYMFHHAYLSYRQHSGQESRNVNQSEPMAWLLNEIKKSNIKIIDQHRYINIKAKYIIQSHLFNKDLVGLEKYLNSEKKCIHVHLAKALFFHKNNFIQAKHVLQYDHYRNLLNIITNNIPLKRNDLISQNKKIILVGSMLCSFYVDAFLRLQGVSPTAVIDFAKARQGQMLNSNMILSYEQFFENDKNECVFIITSEREGDTSIINKIKDHGGKGEFIFWQELFEAKGN